MVLSQADEFESHSQASETIADPTSSFADLNEEFERGETSFAEPAGYSTPQGTDAGEIDFSSAIDSSMDSSPETDPREAMLRQELESVDFYISQGYLDIAVDTLDMLENQFQAHPAIEARRQQLSELSQTATLIAAPAYDNADESEPEAAIIHFGPAPPVDEDEGPPSLSVPPVFADGSLADHAPATTRQTPRPALDSGLADVFEEFRVAEEGDEAGADDFETHYNMGLAYKEMDLLDEAVREFQAAAALVSDADGTPRYLSSCNMLGHCFMEKGLPKAAALWFKKGLAAPVTANTNIRLCASSWPARTSRWETSPERWILSLKFIALTFRTGCCRETQKPTGATGREQRR